MQQTQLWKEDKENHQLLVDSMESKRKHSNGHKRYDRPRKHATTLQSKCTRCGQSPSHDVKSCPAKEAVCRGCGKRGHYKRICKSVKVSIVRTESSKKENSMFLGAVTNYVSKPWMVSLKLNSKNTEFCIDTAAEVSAISVGLESASRFRGMLQKGDQIVQEDIYVVKNLHISLLGRPAIEKLHILARIGSVKQSGQLTVNKFSRLFTGLGKLEGDYTI